MATSTYQKNAQLLVSKGMKMGADSVEVFFLNSKELNIQVNKSKVDNIKVAEERGLAIRVLKNKSMGFAYTSDLDGTALDKALQQALANSVYTAMDPYNQLPQKFGNYPSLSLYDSEITQASVDTKINLAKEIEQYTKNYDKRITITERSVYEDSQYEIFIINSHGLEGYYQGAYCGGYGLAIAEENGESQTGFGMEYSLRFKDINPKKIGEEAGKRAIRLLGAKTVNSQRASIVLEPYIATNFLGVMSPALSAESVQKGKSFLANKVEEAVASPLVTLIDDGSLENGILSSPFDGEGVPTSKTVLLEEGVLKGYLHNTYTANKEDTQSTGNGVRGSFRGTPEIGTTNFYLTPGQISPEEIIKNVEQGLYVTDVMGMHTANPISGDFSLGASGIWIEKGEFIKPVRGIAIAGNLKDILLNIDAVGNDLTFFVGKGSPTVKINNISISGS